MAVPLRIEAIWNGENILLLDFYCDAPLTPEAVEDLADQMVQRVQRVPVQFARLTPEPATEKDLP